MEYTELGRTGLRVSRIGLGAWQFTEAWGLTEYAKAREVVKRALEHRINFFDTAMVYGLGMSETFLGRALREAGAKRDEIVVSTKIPGEFLNPGDIYKAIEKSLKNLGFSYVDILLAHWPPCWHNFPTCEYARALEKASRARQGRLPRPKRLPRRTHRGVSTLPGKARCTGAAAALQPG